MNKREKINYLKQYLSIVEERRELIQSYKYVKSKLTTTPILVLSDMPRTSQRVSDKIGNSIVQIEKLEEIIEDNLKELLNLRIDIENIISQLENSVYRRLMRLRYIEGLKFEIISARMYYGWSRIHELHNEALDLIKIRGEGI